MSSARKDFQPLSRGQNTSRNSLSRTKTTRSFGESTALATLRIIPKSVDTKLYVKPLTNILFFPPDGFPQTRRGMFQSDPILETFRSYYSSSGIMEIPPTGDPGPVNRPLGILALVTAAVSFIRPLRVPSCLYRPHSRLSMHTSPTQPATSLTPLNHSALTAGAQGLYATWTTSRMTSTRRTGTPSFAPFPPSQSAQQRRKPYVMAHPKNRTNVYRSLPLIPLLLAMTEYPVVCHLHPIPDR